MKLSENKQTILSYVESRMTFIVPHLSIIVGESNKQINDTASSVGFTPLQVRLFFIKRFFYLRYFRLWKLLIVMQLKEINRT